MKNNTKISCFIAFRKKPRLVQKLRIRFDRVDGFIRYYDGTKYLVLFGFETYNAINDKISFLMIMPRSKIIQMVNCLLEETLNLHNVVILI